MNIKSPTTFFTGILFSILGLLVLIVISPSLIGYYFEFGLDLNLFRFILASSIFLIAGIILIVCSIIPISSRSVKESKE